MEQSEWASNAVPSRGSDEPLKSVATADLEGPDLHYAGTAVIAKTVKSPEEVIEEMRTWLKTGVAPDGTRMMTKEAWQWYHDYYHGTLRSDMEHECLPENAALDYQYWKAPYLAHIGDMNLVMMYSKVSLPDGTHVPADRLRAETKHSRRVKQLAEKRVQVDLREKERITRGEMEQRVNKMVM